MSGGGRSTSETRRGSGLRWVAALVVAVAFLAAAERGIRMLAARALLPTEGALWIWAPELALDDGPVSFYVGHDLQIPFAPREARLLVLADEEYVVYLNGLLVASNRFEPGAALDAYDVGDSLQRGVNRVLVELRSSRGVGGLLFHLSIRGVDGTVTLTSDRDWRVFREHTRELFEPREPLPAGEPPRVWGPPPVGRWGAPRAAERRPTFAELRSGAGPIDAVEARIGWEDLEWRPLQRVRRRSPVLGNWVTFDWGRDVTGFLSFRFPIEESPLGLIFTGLGPPAPERQRADAFLIPMAGRRAWGDSAPRRFRFATFVGTGEISGAQVFETDPERSESYLAGKVAAKGVFGLQSSRLRTPLEDKIWSELEGVPSLAGGEEP